MKVRNIIRKAATVATSGALAGATLLGAAADLANYPNQFFGDDGFDGHIVVGENALTPDVVGAIDVASSLQGASVTEEPIPDASGRVELEGEGFELRTSSDQLELRENVGDVIDTLSSYELPGLKTVTVVTSEGSTDCFQYLRFKDGNNLQNMSVNYVENDDDNMDTFFVVETDLPFMEWELQCTEGLESDRDTSSNELDDLEDKTLNILGQDFTIVSAEVGANGEDFSLLLMGGSIPDTLREGECRTYSIDGTDYETCLVFVSDPDSAGGTTEAKLAINGELTQALEEGETDTLSDGLQVGIRDILVNDREGVVSFFIGADKLEINDGNTSLQNFGGTIEINNENINDGDLDVIGSFIGTNKFEITDIKYRLEMDADRSSTAYIPPGHGIREFMDRPESLISDSLDVFFAGLEDVVVEPFEIKAVGDDDYDILFTNLQGKTYRFPFVSNENGVFKFGDDDDEFVFVEAANGADHNVGDDDYFAVSNDRGGLLGSDSDKSVTNVLRYEDYDDTDFTLELEDMSSGSTVNVPIETDGTGSLVIGGHTYEVNVSNRTADNPDLAIDQNADDDFANDVITFTAWGGVVFDPAHNVELNSSANLSSSSGAGLAAVVGNGLTLETPTVDADSAFTQKVTLQARVLSKNFDSSDDGNGELNVTVNEDNADTSNPRVDLSVSQTAYRGPLAGDLPGDSGSFTLDEPSDDLDDWEYGMTDWGIFIKEFSPNDADEPNELTLEIPGQQRVAQLFVTLGTIETTTAGSAVTQRVNLLPVGLGILDSEAGAVGSGNHISIGGPCANTFSAELLGNPENCAEGFEEGKAVIRFWDHGDAVSILVAGYNALDTRAASSVLAAYSDYDLEGDVVEVVAPSLNDITVNPIFADGFESGDTSAWSE
ncbi:MAG: hypothetical protein OXR66_00580 [Candidatus Woesearchaeota archaeon]|nr:hypothetical protein [Candidatus Woesearchaeota archaeon]